MTFGMDDRPAFGGGDQAAFPTFGQKDAPAFGKADRPAFEVAPEPSEAAPPSPASPSSKAPPSSAPAGHPWGRPNRIAETPPEPERTVFDKAKAKYPIIERHGIVGKVSPGAREGYLEFWPPGEIGPPDYPRPSEFGDAPGVEIYKEDTTPLDVLGDVTSHWLIEKDPRVKEYYGRFQQSLTPDQRQRLQEQYQYHRENFGETRPYEQWEAMTGLPGYFRGYAFKQWPEEAIEQAYTPDQIAMFDEMMGYLTGAEEGYDPEAGRLQTAAGQTMRGAAGVTKSVVQSVPITQATTAKAMLDVFDKIEAGEISDWRQIVMDRNEYPTFGREREAIEYLRNPDARAEIRKKYADAYLNMREQPLFQFGENIDAAVKDFLAVNPEYAEEFWAGKVPAGFGSMAAFMAAAILGRGAGLGNVAPAGLLGVMAAKGEQFDDAIQSGATLDQALEAAEYGQWIGATEALPISQMLSRLDKWSGGTVTQIVRDAVIEGTEEAAQEAAQAIYKNLVASKIVPYDPERSLFAEAGEGAGVGFTTGALFSFIISLITKGRRTSDDGDGDQMTPEEQAAMTTVAADALDPNQGRPTTRSALENVLNDPRSVDELRAEDEAIRAEMEAQKERVEAEIDAAVEAAEKADAAEIADAAGLPDEGARVTVLDGENEPVVDGTMGDVFFDEGRLVYTITTDDGETAELYADETSVVPFIEQQPSVEPGVAAPMAPEAEPPVLTPDLTQAEPAALENAEDARPGPFYVANAKNKKQARKNLEAVKKRLERRKTLQGRVKIKEDKKSGQAWLEIKGATEKDNRWANAEIRRQEQIIETRSLNAQKKGLGGAKKPQTPLERIAMGGGINIAHAADLPDLDKWHQDRPFMPKLVHERGHSLHYWREQFEQDGILPRGSYDDAVADLINDEAKAETGEYDLTGISTEGTDAEARAEQEAAEREAEEIDAENRRQREEAAAIAASLRERLERDGYEVSDEQIEIDAYALYTDQTDIDTILEREAVRTMEGLANIAAAKDIEQDDIPFELETTNDGQDQVSAGLEEGGQVGQEGEPTSGPDPGGTATGEESGEASGEGRQPQEPQTEKVDTYDGIRDQYVTPGVEAIQGPPKSLTDKKLPPQKDMDIGLFDEGARDQGDMFGAGVDLSKPKEQKTEEKPAEPEVFRPDNNNPALRGAIKGRLDAKTWKALDVQSPKLTREQAEEVAAAYQDLSENMDANVNVTFIAGETAKDLRDQLDAAVEADEPSPVKADERASDVERDKLAAEQNGGDGIAQSDAENNAENKTPRQIFGKPDSDGEYTVRVDGRTFYAFREQNGGGTIPPGSWGVWHVTERVTDARYAGDNMADALQHMQERAPNLPSDKYIADAPTLAEMQTAAGKGADGRPDMQAIAAATERVVGKDTPYKDLTAEQKYKVLDELKAGPPTKGAVPDYQGQKDENTGGEVTTDNSAAEILGKAGITVEKDKTKTGKTVWRIKGNTFDIKDTILKPMGARWYRPAKSWSIFDEQDPSQKIADAIRGSGAVPGKTDGARDDTGADTGPAEAARLRELRQREDQRPDERRDRGDVGGAVSEKTRALISKGLDFGIPQEVVDDQIEDVGMLATAYGDKKPMFLVANEAGTGKAQPLDAKILTPTGWKEMGDIRFGDKVIAGDGSVTTVTGVYPQGEKDIYQVTFSDGSKTECCDEHLWLTETRKSRSYKARNPKWPCSKPKVRPLSEIRETIEGRAGSKNHSIPVVGLVQFGRRDTLLPAYTMGVLLGDGCFRAPGRVFFSSEDPEIAEAVSEELTGDLSIKKNGTSGCPSYFLVSSAPLRRHEVTNAANMAAREYGLTGLYAHEKFVPDDYKWSDVETRLSVLQGLMDTDGWVENSGTSAVFCTTSERLRDDVRFLVNSLGGTVSVSEKRPKGGRLAFNVRVRLPEGMSPFRLPRKAGAYIGGKKYKPVRYIVDVQKVRAAEAQCISISHPSKLYVTDDFIVTHNTFVLGGGIREMRAKGAKRFIYVTMNQDLIAQIKADLKEFGVDDVEFKTYSELSTKGGGVDASGAVLIFDESHNVKNAASARGGLAQGLMGQAEFTVLASATPFENPVQAGYLGSTGIFDQVGGHLDFAKMYGAAVRKRKYFDYKIGKEVIEEIPYWPGGKKEDGAAARQWFFKQGIMTQRPMKIPADMIDSEFRKVSVDQKWVDIYDHVTRAYELALSRYQDENGNPIDSKAYSQIAMHQINMVKRILEASKADAGIKRAKEWLAKTNDNGDPYNVVIFVETKSDREIGRFRETGAKQSDPTYSFPEMERMMAEWQAEADMARSMGERVPKPPFADFIFQIARAMHEVGAQYTLPSTADDIISALGGTDKVALYTGAVSNNKASQNKEDFLSGKKRVLVATMAKGGTGLSLHDKVGDRPTVQININLPWVATQVDQVSGRVARYGLQTRAIIEWLFAGNIPFERVLSTRVGARMRDMGAIVKGVDVKAANQLLENFDFEGVANIRQIAGEGTIEIDEADDPGGGNIYAQAERLEKTRSKAADTSGGFFATPYPVAALMTKVSGLKTGDHVLEPSAGTGNLLKFAPEGVSGVAIEQRDDNFQKLKSTLPKGVTARKGDFMREADTFAPGEFDVVLMNPPFERIKGQGWQDMTHVRRAYDLLAPNGRLVAIVSAGFEFRTDNQTKAFRTWLEETGATIVELPRDTFKQSGTGVNTRLIVVDKSGEAGSDRLQLDDLESGSLRGVEILVPTRFSIASGGGTRADASVDPEKARATVARIAGKWAGPNTVRVVNTFNNLPFSVRQEASQYGLDDGFKGVWHDGIIYIVAEKHHSLEAVEETIFHEVYAHEGLARMFGPALTDEMHKLFRAIGGMPAIRKMADEVGFDYLRYQKAYKERGADTYQTQAILAEELLAHMAGKPGGRWKRAWKEFVGWLRDALRRAGFQGLASYTDADMRYLLRKARRAVQRDLRPVDIERIVFSLDKRNQGSFDGDDFERQQPNGGRRKGKRRRDKKQDGARLPENRMGANNNPDLERVMRIRDDEIRAAMGMGRVYNPDDPLRITDRPLHTLPESAAREFKPLKGEALKYVRSMQQQGVMSGTFEYESRAVRDWLRDRNIGLVARWLGAIRATAKDARQKLQDRYIDLRDIQAAIERRLGSKLPQNIDAYLAEELYHGRTGYRLDKLRREVVEPLMKKIADANVTVKDVEAFLYARHAQERNEAIEKISPDLTDGSGMDTGTAQMILDMYRNDGLYDTLESIAKDIDAINKMRLDYLSDRENNGEAAILDDKTRLKWEQTYKHYVPLRGFEAEDADVHIDSGTRTGKGFDIRGAESKRALGRESRAANILATVIAQTEEAIVRVEKNRVGRAFLRLVQGNPNPALWEINVQHMKRSIDKTTGLVKVVPDGNRNREDNVLAVKVGDKVHYITIHHPRLAKAIKNVGAESMNMMMQWMQRYVRFLAAVNTSWNPEFLLSNLPRDVQTAGINLQAFRSKEFKGLTRDIMRDIALINRSLWGAYQGVRGKADSEWQKWFDEFAKEGGRIAFFGLESIEQKRDKLDGLLKAAHGGRSQNVRRALVAAFQFVEDYNQAFENVARLSTYVNLRKRGIDKKTAASIARNLTVNFNRKGEWGPQIGALYLFFNASIQGTQIMFRAMTHKRVQKVAAGVVITAFFMEMLNYYLAPEDEDGEKTWDKVTPWTKAHNWMLVNPFADPKSTDIEQITALKLPMPYGYNVLHVIGTKMGEAARGKTDFWQASADVISSAFDAFNPIGGSESLWTTIMPTVVKPFAEIWQNENFMGVPIYPEQSPYDVPKPDSQLAWQSVSEPADWVAKKLNEWTGGSEVEQGLADVSPETLDHFVEFTTGGAGTFFRRVFDGAVKIAQGEEFQWKEVPFVRRLIEGENEWWGRQRYNELNQSLRLMETQYRFYTKEKRSEDADRIINQDPALWAMYPAIKNAEKKLKKLRSKRRKIEAAPDLEDARREELSETVRAQQSAIEDQIIYLYNRARKADDLEGARAAIRAASERLRKQQEGGQ